MEIPPQARKIVAILCVVLIVFWIGLIVRRVSHPSGSGDQYVTMPVDRNIGWVAAEEAYRIAGGNAQVVLILSMREKPTGSQPERQAQSFVQGFHSGSYDEKGKPRDIKILAEKYKTDDPKANPYLWPPVSYLAQIAKEFPACNVVVCFCDPPQLTGDEGPIDLSRLPPVIATSRSAAPPAGVKQVFDTGLVHVLFNPRFSAANAGSAEKPRAVVEQYYWVVTKENLQEMLTKMAGG